MAPGSELGVTDAEISPLMPRSEKGTRSISASAMVSFSRTRAAAEPGPRSRYAVSPDLGRVPCARVAVPANAKPRDRSEIKAFEFKLSYRTAAGSTHREI